MAKAVLRILVVAEVHVNCVYNFILRVSDQNGASLLYIVLEIHHFGREPSNYTKAYNSKNKMIGYFEINSPSVQPLTVHLYHNGTTDGKTSRTSLRLLLCFICLSTTHEPQADESHQLEGDDHTELGVQHPDLGHTACSKRCRITTATTSSSNFNPYQNKTKQNKQNKKGFGWLFTSDSLKCWEQDEYSFHFVTLNLHTHLCMCIFSYFCIYKL